MNVLIPDSWLKEHLKTQATPQKMAECLSLSGPSVEKVTQVGNDYVYDIEVTTNRIDTASVIGIAREAAAILPRFGIKARFLKPQPQKPKQPKKSLPIKIKNDSHLCRRVLGVVLDNVKIKPSPKFIKARLEAAGIRSLSNLIDITNYVMLEIGHPTHVFDYDRIKTHQLIIRRSKKGEKIISLENKKYILPGSDTVIDDGTKKIIDLPGIIGTENSVVTPKTKRVLFFIENNEPSQMRRTSMTLGIRTLAATFNEKGVDPELALTALLRGIELYQKYANAKIASKIIDIYPHPPRPKKVSLTQEKLSQIMGIKISLPEAKEILDPLGFQSTINNQQSTIVTLVPSWRAEDISIPQDLIEEIARIYGYHNLPSRLVTGQFSEAFKGPFDWEDKTKDIVKNWGFMEIYSYSFISEDLLAKIGFNPQDCLKLANLLTSEWEYMRPSLIPGVLQTVKENQSREEEIKIFELANVYLPRKSDLPYEKMMLVGALSGPVKVEESIHKADEKFYQAKGIIEVLLNQMGIEGFKFIQFSFKIYDTIVSKILKLKLWHPGRTAAVMLQNSKKGGKNTRLGIVGEIHPSILEKFGIDNRVTVFELDLEEIVKHVSEAKTYTPIPKYPPIVEDLAFIVPEKTLVGEMIREIQKLSNPPARRAGLIIKAELLDSYQNTRTFRITYQHPNRTLTDREVKEVRKKIISRLEKKLGSRLKV